MKEQVKNDKTKDFKTSPKRISPLYRLIQENLFHEERLLAERISIFLLASSFLILGFISLMGAEGAEMFGMSIPIIGIVISLLMNWNIWRARGTLKFWNDEWEKIDEAEGLYFYKRLRKEQNRGNWKHILKRGSSPEAGLYITGLFFLFWVISLIWSI